MAKFIFTTANLTWAANNAGSAITNASSYMAVKGGASTQVVDFLDISITGKATTTTILATELARTSTQETAATTLAAPHSNGPMQSYASAPTAGAPVCFVTAGTTHPTPSNVVTDGKIQLGMNAFGGYVRWQVGPFQQWSQYGNTAATWGESILFNNGLAAGASCLADAHIMYEPF